MYNYIIAVDIGNTNTHIGLVNCSSRGILSLDIFPSMDIDTRLVDSIVSLSISMKHAAPVPIVVCSVIKSIEARYNSTLCKLIESPVLWLKYSPALPVVVNYENPYSLGADRLANFFYCYDVFNGKNLIIIDAGTAIKIDYLKNGREFFGGVILPGLATQLQSLHDKTDQLPPVNVEEIGLEFPGLSTQSCILGGVRLGIAGSLSFLVKKFKQHFNEDAIILATGGSWKYLQEYMQFEFEFIPELTLVGCALYNRHISI
ncbi:MAG TPA: hypothetical protein DCO75_12420 [Fibrobacteres bacterium]|jgi:type III pantothenate kinase|nr:hypothetical protein [Fibrobacterota bacterium]